MATRSFIAVQNPDTTYTAVYCHWDGYPEGVGDRLVRFYNSTAAARALLNIGDFSALETSLERTAENRYDISSSTENTVEDLWEAFSACEYGYIWNGEQWECHSGEGMQYNLYAPRIHPLAGAYYTPVTA